MKRLANIVISLFVVFTFTQSVQAQDFSNITSSNKISQALNSLEQVGENGVISTIQGQNLTQKPIRVMFRDLSIYGQYNCEAVTMKTNSGSLVIFINNRHMGASPEALASLIAHESVHQAQTNTLSEEVQAWTTEARTWQKFNQQDATLSLDETKLTKRLNYISNLYSQNGSNSLQKIIASNPVYASLK